MRAFIRKVETRQVEVSGEGLPEIQERLTAATPPGFDLVSAPVTMAKASTTITAVGTFARRDEIRELHGATRAELLAQVPDGWQMLYVVK